ncbi:MAG: hypothetical protein GXP09_04745 [Gammaproteobacteria bacterium]|nr:hypothetical protein [Gammaproteobacteria bacterium]
MNPIVYISYVGVLRVLLHGVSVMVIGFSRITGGPPVYTGWEMVPSLIVPALVPIVFFVLLLDMMMAMVFMVDRTGEIRRRYRVIALIDLALVVALFFFWLQYFLSIGQ